MTLKRIFAVSALVALTVVPLLPGLAEGSPRGTLSWRNCATPATSPRLQCATLEVPVDWSKPDGLKVSLKLSRIPAANANQRIGALFLNPGGPGGAITDVLAYNGMIAGYPEMSKVVDRFDLVGMDSRGVGGSSPVECDKSLLHDPSVSVFPTDQSSFSKLADMNRKAGISCQKSIGPLMATVDSVSVARDMDAVRAAMGEDKISFYGESYGGELGEIYAREFGSHVRTMVLDAPADHGLSTITAAEQESSAIEDSFNRFANWCAVTKDCALSGRNVPQLVDALLASGSAPAPWLGRNATAEELTSAIYAFLTSPEYWPQLGQSLAEATGAKADASGLVQASMFLNPIYPAYRVIGCQDFAADLRGPGQVTHEMSRLKKIAPHMWRYSEFWDFASGCVGWPVPAKNPPSSAKVVGVSPILVIGGTHDPATPLNWARNVTKRIEHSSLLIDERDGHGALDHSACARQKAADYLVSGVAPHSQTICVA